jgi:hypothetical protein
MQWQDDTEPTDAANTPHQYQLDTIKTAWWGIDIAEITNYNNLDRLHGPGNNPTSEPG